MVTIWQVRWVFECDDINFEYSYMDLVEVSGVQGFQVPSLPPLGSTWWERGQDGRPVNGRFVVDSLEFKNGESPEATIRLKQG